MTSQPVHVEPDETISRAGLDQGAPDASAILTKSLIRAFQNSA
jgi:hypothetical protein